MRTAKQVAHALCGIGAIVLLTTCQAADGTGPVGGDPSAIALVSGNGQAGLAGVPLAQPLVVRVTTASGAGVAGVTVTWAVTAGGGNLSSASTTTDENGQASVTWTLGEVVGANGVQATASGLSGSPVSFGAISTAGLPTQLALTSGNNQTGRVGQPLAESLVVVARDRFDNPASGVVVTWAVSSGGSLVSANAGRTDPQGRSLVAWILGIRAGGQIVTASLPGATGSLIVFNATALAGSAAALMFAVQPGNTTVGTAIAPVEVAVVDSFGNTVFSAANPVAVTLGANPGGATLSGTTQVNALNGVAKFSNLTIDRSAAGYSLSATAVGLTGATSTAFDVTPPPPPTQLVFTGQPGNASAGTVIAPPVTVTALDAQGHTVAGFSGSVTVVIASNPAGGTLSGTTTVAATAGVASFSSLGIDKVGTGYMLQASATGLAPDTSDRFDITPGGGARLIFTAQPSRTTAGAPITPAVELTVQDSLGNTLDAFMEGVTVALGSNAGSSTLFGTTTVNAMLGVATFSNLIINQVGTGYTLTASASGATRGASAAFDITPGPATQLVFTTQPGNTTAGAAIAPPVHVTAVDGQGNTATGFTGDVTVGISAGTAGATLSGTRTVRASAGVASFSSLSIDSAGAGYTLQASSGNLTLDTSIPFDITPGPANRLAFTIQPSTTDAGAPMTPAVEVRARDALGNAAPSFSGNVRVAIFDNPPPGGTLAGTTTVAAEAGVATFSSLSISKTGSGYTLIGTATGLVSDVSAPFDIIPGPASQLAFTVQPSNALVGTAIAPPVEVTATDAHGNAATGFTDPVTIAITPGTGSLGARLSGATTVTASAGVATFPSLAIDKPASGYTLRGISGALTGTSAAFAITASGSVSVAAGDGQSGLVGFALNIPPAVLVRDAANLPVANVAVTFAVAGGGGSVSNTEAATDANGVATVGSWTVGLGVNTLTATVQSAGVAGNPVTFTAIGVSASYDFDVRYLTSVAPEVQQAFDSGVVRWRRLIYMDVPDVGANIAAGTCGPGTPAFNEPIDDLVIFVQLDSIDGLGKNLVQAAPCIVRGTGRLPAIGTIRLDTADLAVALGNGQLDDLVLHAMGHVLGFGTIWLDLGLLAGGGGADPHFVGSQAIMAFDRTGGAGYSAAKVPVENCAGMTASECATGIRDSHWRESVLGVELMSGRLDAGVRNPLSMITAASMADLGYAVNYAASHPYLVANPQQALPGPRSRLLDLAEDVLPLSTIVIDPLGRIIRVIAPR